MISLLQLRPNIRRLPLYLLAATTLLALLGLAHLSTSSSPYSPASLFSGLTVAALDDSSWEFDPDTNEHRAFCRSLSSKAEFAEALEQQQALSSTNASPRLAPHLSAVDLLNNKLLELGRSSPVTGIPLIIHQSWKDHSPPAAYDDLILSWRRTYPDAVYVLWNDAENQMLVDQRYPELKEVYKGFEKEIYKADFIRNLYMHAFGGIYGDLDSEALHPLHDLFASLAPSSNQNTVAFLGEMHTTTYHSHSVPNAFMASSPGHPFWMAGPVERAIKAFKDGTGGDPEHLTGPVALKESWEGWEKSGRAEKEGEVVLLDESVIYPYSWDARTEIQECLCWAKSPTFNAPYCKLLYPSSFTINYWKHSW